MLALLIANRRIIAEIVGALVIALIAWWFFIHNPKVIAGLEDDKKELQRQVNEGIKAAALLTDIENGKVKINAKTFQNISTIRASIIPRRAILISGGLPLQTLPKANPSH